MDYALAKELKEAGFPQGDFVGFNFQEDLSYPTLSELIEACGPIAYDGNFNLAFNSRSEKWVASYADFYNFIVREDLLAEGSAPEEAVARLWLALNPQKNPMKSTSGEGE